MTPKIIIVDDLPLQHERLKAMVLSYLRKKDSDQIEFVHYLESISFLQEIEKIDSSKIALIYIDQRFTNSPASDKVLSAGRDPQQEGSYIVRQLLKHDLRKKIYFFGRNIPGIDDTILDLMPATIYERNIYFFTAVRLASLNLLGELPFDVTVHLTTNVPKNKKEQAQLILDGRRSFFPDFEISWKGCKQFPDLVASGNYYFKEQDGYPDSIYRLLSVFSLLQLWKKPQDQMVCIKGDWNLILQTLSELSGIAPYDDCWSWLKNVKDGSSFRTNHFAFWQRQGQEIPNILRDLICNLGSSYAMLANVKIREHLKK